jgi:MFS family permease
VTGIRLRSGAGAALITATVLASMAGFLDASVVNVAVPAIGKGLGAGVVALQWTLTGYLLTAAALLLVAGAFADKFGRRRCWSPDSPSCSSRRCCARSHPRPAC